ncbi:ATP-binding domain-containing protein [Bradyrhizobium guangxiense]|uniref:ATP-binding domain-containing protein n=1 Tax=Bradyrhizobium guangxiense TaxID=1325115 RepID=UPI0010086BFD|nr:ATP-binding domain-containing protein [Bradyrhizobium guangxiense]
MSDDTVRIALRSDARLVVVEAPAGCGKTHQGADYVGEVAGNNRDRVLILTHTHAACSVFAKRTRGIGSHVEIRTIDSLVAQVATAYHIGLGIPADPMIWVRQRPDGYAQLAARVAQLFQKYPMIGRAAAKRYPTVICDEHQDSSADQHAIAMALHSNGSRVRVFADPMQKIFKEANPYSWVDLVGAADRIEELDHPHRWANGCPELGKWTLAARNALKAGGKVDLRTAPPSMKIVDATNIAQKNLDYRLGSNDRRAVDAFEKRQSSLLVLTRYNETARALRSFFDRRILLWEGYTRSALEVFVQQLDRVNGPEEVAVAIMKFMESVAVGFSPSEFGKRLDDEIADRCSKNTRGKPALIQELARLVLESPDHKGAARMLTRLHEFTQSEPHFKNVKLDCHREFWDAVRIGQFDNPADGLADLARRRAYARPQPPERAISTIHKAKGLECESVIVMPCDAKSFPDTAEARCLLYVALSRAKGELMLVLSPDKPSPLFVR